MRQVQKKYWVNGHEVRGMGFHTLTFSLGKYAVMICYGKVFGKTFIPYINLYKLI